MTRISRYLVSLVLIVAGISWIILRIDLLPSYTSVNDVASTALQHTRASKVAVVDLHNGVFIGAAFSGGGSRAANFSAAVLLELEELGLLPQITALSSVSGSALPVTYYALYGNDSTRWNPDHVRELFALDYESKWIWRSLLPSNWVRIWFTNFDKS